MLFERVITGVVALYMVAAPCSLVSHAPEAGFAVSDGHNHNAHAHHHHEDSERATSGDSEHCCDDTEQSLLSAPSQKVVVSAALPIEHFLSVLLFHDNAKQTFTGLARDGPLYEQAAELAHILVLLS